MQYRIVPSVLFLACAMIAIAGCTGTQNAPATPVIPSAPSGASPANLVISPTDLVPKYNLVKVDVGEKDYLGNIPVIFQGGMGQIHVKMIDVTLYRSDGLVKKTVLGTKKGDQVELEGTKQIDRVAVRISMDNGDCYTINDVQSPYRTRQ